MFCLLVEAVRVEVVEDSAVVGVYLGGPEDVSRGRGCECLTDRPTVLSASQLPPFLTRLRSRSLTLQPSRAFQGLKCEPKAALSLSLHALFSPFFGRY